MAIFRIKSWHGVPLGPLQALDKLLRCGGSRSPPQGIPTCPALQGQEEGFGSSPGALASTTYKHGGPILERAGHSWHAGIVGQPGVAVPGRQGGAEEGLLSGMVRLRLVLLRLGQGGGRRGRGRIPTTKFCYVTWNARKRAPCTSLQRPGLWLRVWTDQGCGGNKQVILPHRSRDWRDETSTCHAPSPAQTHQWTPRLVHWQRRNKQPLRGSISAKRFFDALISLSWDVASSSQMENHGSILAGEEGAQGPTPFRKQVVVVFSR